MLIGIPNLLWSAHTTCLCCPAGIMKILVMIAYSVQGLVTAPLRGVLSYKKRDNDEEEHSIGLSVGEGGTIIIFAYNSLYSIYR